MTAAELEQYGQYQDTDDPNTILAIGPSLDDTGIVVHVVCDGYAIGYAELTPAAALQLGVDITVLANDLAGSC